MKKTTKNRVFMGILTFVMVICLFVVLPAPEASAANFKKPIVDKDTITLYPSGCLKSITITVQAAGTYATAYGRIGVHTGKTAYNWNNRFITSSSCTSWPAESVFVSRDATFVAFANGNEFLWSDGKANTITFTFTDGKVDLSKNQTYYLYLWTRASAYGIYTDAELGTLKTEDGKLMDGSGNTLVESEPHKHTLVLEPAKAATCTAIGNTAYYKCTGCSNIFADEDGNTPTTLEAVQIGTLQHSLSGATCTTKGICAMCGNAFGEVDSTNHAGGTEIRNTIEATCGAGGYTGDIYCKGCTKLIETGTATPATGAHHYGDWAVITEATATAVGEKQRTCPDCGDVDSQEIPMLSHVPETGDNANLMLYGAMLIVSAAALVVLRLNSGKRRQANEYSGRK